MKNMTAKPPISPELLEMVLESCDIVLLKDTYLKSLTQAKKMQSPRDHVNRFDERARA